MQNSALPFHISDSGISVSALDRFSQEWFLSCEINQNSAATLKNRRLYVRNLLWFLRRNEFAQCGVSELRAFFSYLINGHKEPCGRWGNPRECKPVKPSTSATYYSHLRALFRWIVAEGGLPSSPMERIKPPIDRADQVTPLSSEQLESLLAAAKTSQHPRRNESILLFLLDTGLRNTELCSLRLKDVDMTARRCSVEGKGGKKRTVHFSKHTAKALWGYLRENDHEPDDPVFVSERGDALTRYGLTQLFERLNRTARITDVRVSPHSLRHTFAVEFLRAGGNQMTLMRILGHEDLKMTARYVRLAEADIERQQQEFSPVNRLKRRSK